MILVDSREWIGSCSVFSDQIINLTPFCPLFLGCNESNTRKTSVKVLPLHLEILQKMKKTKKRKWFFYCHRQSHLPKNYEQTAPIVINHQRIPNSPNNLDNSKISNVKLNKEQYLRDFAILIFQTKLFFLLPWWQRQWNYEMLELKGGRKWAKLKAKEVQRRKKNWKQATKFISNYFKTKRIHVSKLQNIIHYYPS